MSGIYVAYYIQTDTYINYINNLILENLNIPGVRNERETHNNLPQVFLTCEIERIAKPNLADKFNIATQFYDAIAFKGQSDALSFILNQSFSIHHSAVNKKHLRNADFLWLSGDIG